MFDGKKDINGYRNKKKTDKDSMNRKKVNYLQILCNTKMKTIKVCT